MNYDCLLKNGTVVDGSGNKAFSGSVAVKDGKIAAIIRSEADTAAAAALEEGACGISFGRLPIKAFWRSAAQPESDSESKIVEPLARAAGLI